MAIDSINPRFTVLREITQRPVRITSRPMDENGVVLPTSAFFGDNTFGLRQMRDKLPAARVRLARRLRAAGPQARQRDRARRRAGHQGMGDLARRHALHALVPAADRPHGREARRVPHASTRTKHADRAVLRRAAHPVRARRVVASRRAACAPPGKRAATRRGTRPARCSSMEDGGTTHAVHPVRVHRLQRRGARRDDAAAPQLRRALREGASPCSTLHRRQGRAARATPRSAPSRSSS